MLLTRSNSRVPADCLLVAPTNVKLINYDPWPQKLRGRGAKAAGLRYQDRVTLQFEADCLRNCHGEGWAYVAGPWVKYYDCGKKHHAQPDGLFLNFLQGRVIIVEVKLSYCVKAWWQLCAKYAPLVGALFPQHLWDISLLAVANTVTPQPTPTPGKFVQSWAAQVKDVAILRLPEKTLPRLR